MSSMLLHISMRHCCFSLSAVATSFDFARLCLSLVRQFVPVLK